MMFVFCMCINIDVLIYLQALSMTMFFNGGVRIVLLAAVEDQ